MAKTASKMTNKTTETKRSRKSAQKPRRTYKTFKQAFADSREKVWNKKRARLKLHHSFRRSYREDYARPLAVPGLVSHAMSTLKILFKNWKLFGGLLVLIVASNIVLVGLMSEDTYKTVQDSLDQSYSYLSKGQLGSVAKSGLLLISTVTSGGLTSGMTEVQAVFAVFLFAVAWLTTIYFLRHLLAGNHPKFRDGIFNSMTPLISSLCSMLIIFVHAIPILLFVVLYSTALSTNFLSQPLYAFLFWLFGLLLILLSCYLLPGSILGLVATSVPGIYPMAATHAATDLIQGRRTKFIIRIVFMLVFLAVIWVIIMLPLIWLDLVLKQNFDFLASIPFVPLLTQIMTTFSIIYITAYIYLFYRRMLDDPR